MIFSDFSEPDVMAELVSKMLFEIKAVNFSPDKPYHLTSGIVSPVYIDCRKLISFARVRSTIMDFATTIVLRNIGFESIDVIAGGETAGIPFAAFLAERLSLPMIYVRKKLKSHGKKSQIEGFISKGNRVLIIEDSVTLGGSMLDFAKIIRSAGGIVQNGIGLFFYGIFPEIPIRLRENGINLNYIVTWNDIIKVAEKMQIFDQQVLQEVRCFIDNPMQWSERHGGISKI
ncbi:MAG: orotate phosphoribosyltransferase [Candidatus Liberibacter europaeus]|uniref:Orotate phosphoribosyltransferase n=1 Tax=Candidatus Liberibacter europaeus TaxID=744859 RepID=A0A2T4VWZ2_9HYPH|nr:orotate phosphoribosyltransferase [Candidatus Liberibacter europaeus]PTL86294.1 MAG: orotate phosphoribosyltransferase [Candidatus Liberibacter europaeus]